MQAIGWFFWLRIAQTGSPANPYRGSSCAVLAHCSTTTGLVQAPLSLWLGVARARAGGSTLQLCAPQSTRCCCGRLLARLSRPRCIFGGPGQPPPL